LLSRLVRARPLAAAAVASTSAAAVAFAKTDSECLSFFSSKPTVEMKYFGLPGVAETLRMTLALGECPWTETKWPVDFSKFSGPASIHIACPPFGEARSAGELVLNLDRAPVVIVDGKYTLGQTKSLERYFARRLGLLGGSEIEAAHIDAFVEHVRDVKDKYQKAKADKDKEVEVKKFFDETMPEFMGKIEKAVAASGVHSGAPLIGKKLSLADVTLYVFIIDFFDNKEGAKASIAKCPMLQASVKAVEENPAIAKYRASK